MLLVVELLMGGICLAQDPVQVSAPRLKLEGNLLHIYYDILNSESTDEFTVNVEFTYADGTVIKANTLTGDVGKKVFGGSNKKITWNLNADNVYLSEEILIRIDVDVIRTQLPYRGQGETRARLNEAEKKQRTYNMLRALALPGLGLTNQKGGPHWLKGVVGYGCIAGSVYYNRLAVRTYGTYLDQSDIEVAKDYFDQSNNQDLISEVLAYTAVGIWVTDLMWTFLATSGSKQKQAVNNPGNFHVRTRIDPVTMAPMLGLQFRF